MLQTALRPHLKMETPSLPRRRRRGELEEEWLHADRIPEDQEVGLPAAREVTLLERLESELESELGLPDSAAELWVLPLPPGLRSRILMIEGAN